MQQTPLFDFIAKQNLSGLSKPDFLKQLTKQHPYFIPAQFYLLQQMEETDAAYPLQVAKTAVLFNNPYWLHFQLHHADEVVTIKEEIPAPAIVPSENSDNDDDTVILAEKQPLTDEQLMLAENADNNDDEAEMEQEIEPIKITIPNLKPQAGNENAPAFEPMHLVDYFASQGIKLSDEVQTADKLGKQLKSFTEWLKTMKKIHTPDNEANAGISDIAIQALAAKSNKEGEVVTEAMADVLIQQGKAGKAIEVYQKLSLLNPSKSAFFAAKIEQLKGS